MRKTAGQISNEIAKDTTKYDALEVGHAMADDIGAQLYESVARHINIIDEKQFCVVMVLAKDPLLAHLIRRKFYCWPYLPKPRPNQAVFLYDKSKERITKRLWVLPSDMVMAELAGTSIIVDKTYETMQAWSVAFFRGTFWEYIRHEHKIDMPSEHEYFLANRQKLIEAGCQPVNPLYIEPFDFSKIQAKQVVDPLAAVIA